MFELLHYVGHCHHGMAHINLWIEELASRYGDWLLMQGLDKKNGNSLIFLTWLYSQGYNIYCIYTNIPRIFFPEFTEEKLGCAHYLKQGWYCSASKQNDPLTR